MLLDHEDQFRDNMTNGMDSCNTESEADFGTAVSDFSNLLVSSSDWTVETLFGQIKKQNIDLSPFFQRRQVWDVRKQSAFIESLILGIPVPQIVIAQDHKSRGKYIVLDGKQRLLSVLAFYENRLSLANPDLLRDLKGLKYENLNQDYRDALDNATIRAVRLVGWNDDSVLYSIFYRLNSGSVSLNTQELRSALYPGAFTNFAATFTETDYTFARLFSRTADCEDFRMRDIEMLTRYCGLVYRPTLFTGNLKEFLDSTTQWLNGINDSQQYKNMANEAVATIIQCKSLYEIITERIGGVYTPAFSLIQTEKKQSFNRAVFDALCYPLQDADIRSAISGHETDVALALEHVLSSDSFISECTVSTKTKTALISRVNIWACKLHEVIGGTINTLRLSEDGKSVEQSVIR